MELFWVVMLVWLVMWSISNMYRTYEREKTRRDIAAYIAEGSMTPEHGEKLMRAGESPEKR